MRDLLLALASAPSRETYLELYRALVAQPGYAPYSRELAELEELVERGELEAAANLITTAMGNLILSPRAHSLASRLYDGLGDSQGAQMERVLTSACLRGITSTGDGSFEAPYLVARVSDERDVANALDQRVEGSSLHSDGERHYDALHLADGSKLWFDITDAYNRLQSQMAP